MNSKETWYSLLKKYNVDLNNTKEQSDNGTEFTIPWNSIKDSGFTIINSARCKDMAK